MNNEVRHKCNICGEDIGSIDAEAGIFDSRYDKNYETHTCKEWTTIGE